MTRRLTLLCVPATAALRAGRFPADDALEEGAAVPIARWAGKLGAPDHVLCSPMACARDTVRALGL
ncbi:histidine phosphatase family protein, partial [Cupriavidus sp. CER94]